jgi:hypothetical protein
MLPPRNRSEYLSYLIRLGHAFVVLDIHARIALPRQAVEAMTGAALACDPEVAIAHPAKIREANSLGIASHLSQNIPDACHIQIVSLLILYVKPIAVVCSIIRYLTPRVPGRNDGGRDLMGKGASAPVQERHDQTAAGNLHFLSREGCAEKRSTESLGVLQMVCWLRLARKEYRS